MSLIVQLSGRKQLLTLALFDSSGYSWTLRASVAVQAISDASGTLAIFLMVYQYAVPNYGIPASLEIQGELHCDCELSDID